MGKKGPLRIKIALMRGAENIKSYSQSKLHYSRKALINRLEDYEDELLDKEAKRGK